MVREQSPFELDRVLARGVPRIRAARRALHEGTLAAELALPEVLLDPEVHEQLAALTSDPLATALLRWCYWLSVTQRELALERNLIELYRDRRHPLDAPLRGHFSLRELSGYALRDAARRPALLDVLVERSAELGSALERSWEERASLERFAGKPRDELELPLDSSKLEASALDLLAKSSDAFGAVAPRSAAELLELGLALRASDGWPRTLDLRSLHGLIGEAGLLDGLRLDVGRMPAAIAPASFLRGLLRLGAAWTDALAPAAVPFALARDPFGLWRSQHGALFALVALSPAFLRRKLGLGSDRAQSHARALSASALAFARLAALKLLLRGPALRGRRSLRDAFGEHGTRALGFEPPPGAAGVLPRVAPALELAQRFAAPLLAATRFRELTEEHDEDWFRNPRAIERLRAEAAIRPEIEVSEAALGQGALDFVALAGASQ